MAAVSSVSDPGGTLNYIGNPDYRGYLNALAAGGDATAGYLIGQGAPQTLGYVDNSGNITDVLAPQYTNENSTDYANYQNIINGGGTGGSNSTSSSTTTDPNAVAYYNDVISQLQSQIASAQAQQPTLISNIENAANQQQSQLNQNESNAETGYATQRSTNGQNRAQNIGAINMNSNATFNSLMQLLNGAGSGVSSAAQFGAPQAVALDASGKRAGADTAYNTNAAAIDTAEGQTKQQYQNALSDLLTQENTQKGNALAGILNQIGSLQQQLSAADLNKAEYGGMTYTQAQAQDGTNRQAVQNTEQQLNDVFKQYATPTFNVKPVTVATPNMTNYNVDPTTIKAEQANPGTTSAFLPYLQNLKQGNGTGNLLTGGAPTGAAPTATAATAGAAA